MSDRRSVETERRTVLQDGDKFRWEPSNWPGLWDMVPVPGVWRFIRWSREDIESVWPPVIEISETVKEAS